MAQTTLTATQLSYSDGVATGTITQGAGTAINTANTMRVLAKVHGRLMIVIDSDHASTAATFYAGDFSDRHIGTKAVAVGNGVSTMIFPDFARFKDEDGYIEWEWAANSAGFVRVFDLVNE